MKSAIYMNGNRFTETSFRHEEDFEKIVKENYKILFGSKTIYFDLKNRIDSKSLGSSIPDGILFDFRDTEDPRFYLVEVELAEHEFDRHIFPQITKFLAFFKNPASTTNLIEKLFFLIKSNDKLEEDFKRFLGKREIYKALKDIIENNKNILLIIDEYKPEIEEVSNIYKETWGKIVKVEILKEYSAGSNKIFTLNPDFEGIGILEPISHDEKDDNIVYNEKYHLEDAEQDIVSLYNDIKTFMIDLDSNIKINPQKYYISLREKKNFAYLDIKRKKIKIAIMLPYEKGKTIITHHKLREFTEGIQRFYGNPSFEVKIEDKQNFDEIKIILEEAYKNQK